MLYYYKQGSDINQYIDFADLLKKVLKLLRAKKKFVDMV